MVTLAVYIYLLSTILGNQILDPDSKIFANKTDPLPLKTIGYTEEESCFPVFPILEFFFYMGWLKVT